MASTTTTIYRSGSELFYNSITEGLRHGHLHDGSFFHLIVLHLDRFIIWQNRTSFPCNDNAKICRYNLKIKIFFCQLQKRAKSLGVKTRRHQGKLPERSDRRYQAHAWRAGRTGGRGVAFTGRQSRDCKFQVS